MHRTADDPTRLTADDIDIYDLDKYERDGVPHAEFAWLRRHAPVFWHPEPGGRGFWAVTRHEDIKRISSDPQTFSSEVGGTNIQDYEGQDLDNLRMILINMDPPHHVRFRKLIRGAFTPRAIARVKEMVERRAREIVDAVAKKGECEFVTEVAAELPLQVIADLVGIPQEDRAKVFDWTNRLVGFDDPEYSNLSMEEMREAAAEVWMYADQLAEQRRDSTGDDLVSILLRSEIDGERLTPMQFDSFFLLIALAGNETTRTAISQSVLTLIEHPQERERLAEDPSLMPSAVEELLRWTTPVMHFRRTATRDVELRGQKIKAGDKVVMFYPSANRDEAVFDSPDSLILDRHPNEHLAFGYGEHYCVGAHLARLELGVMITEVLRRLKNLELAGPVRRLRSNFIHGIKEMPVRFTPEARGGG